MEYSTFKDIVWEYYHQSRRELPWRERTDKHNFDPYRILVSEMMLQQTQVTRVIPKYNSFLQQFPTIDTLAQSPLSKVITSWSGLGYNRRAKFLHQTARIINNDYHGLIPRSITDLVTLPGIGYNTAAAILTYAFNQPHVFVETNVRTVYIHHFFTDQSPVDDKQLQPIIEVTLDYQYPRDWYWALMDYGSYLKTSVGNVSRRSKQYTKQNRFEGSRRQLRGAILRELSVKALTEDQLIIIYPDIRISSILDDLNTEGFIEKVQNKYRLRLT